jgi:hypothetical protein
MPARDWTLHTRALADTLHECTVDKRCSLIWLWLWLLQVPSSPLFAGKKGWCWGVSDKGMVEWGRGKKEEHDKNSKFS